MAHNHLPPWMNANTRLRAYLPLPTNENVSLIDKL